MAHKRKKRFNGVLYSHVGNTRLKRMAIKRRNYYKEMGYKVRIYKVRAKSYKSSKSLKGFSYDIYIKK